MQFLYICSRLHIHVLFAHDADRPLDRQELVLELLLLPLHRRCLHADRHLGKQRVNLLFVLFEIGESLEPLGLGEERGAWRLALEGFGLLLGLELGVFLDLGLFFEFVEVFWYLAEVLLLFVLGGGLLGSRTF